MQQPQFNYYQQQQQPPMQQLQQTVPCYRCNGNGTVFLNEYDMEAKVCPGCNGQRVILASYHRCIKCQGKGKYYPQDKMQGMTQRDCQLCQNKGYTQQQFTQCKFCQGNGVLVRFPGDCSGSVCDSCRGIGFIAAQMGGDMNCYPTQQQVQGNNNTGGEGSFQSGNLNYNNFISGFAKKFKFGTDAQTGETSFQFGGLNLSNTTPQTNQNNYGNAFPNQNNQYGMQQPPQYQQQQQPQYPQQYQQQQPQYQQQQPQYQQQQPQYQQQQPQYQQQYQQQPPQYQQQYQQQQPQQGFGLNRSHTMPTQPMGMNNPGGMYPQNPYNRY